ncbi:MAG: glutamine synthetase family protein [Pseudomonadota bacterium]
MADASRELLEDFFARHAVETVILCGTDLIGKQRGKRVTVPYFREAAVKGIRLASFINQAALLDEPFPDILEGGVPDLVGRPDLSTLQLAPWEPAAAIVFLDWHESDGSPHPLCVRTLLRDQTRALADLGHQVRAAFEYEFFLVPQGAERPGLAIGQDDASGMPEEIQCYGIMEGGRDEALLSRLRAALPEIVEGVIPEWGQGQREANLRPSGAVAAADNAVLLKLAVKTLAAREGFTASFMAKWRSDRSGSSAHLHLSLWDAAGRPSFHAAEAPQGLSPLLLAWLAGQVALCRETAIFHAPFVNSYRRFQPGSFAPTKVTAGLDNRSTAFRILNDRPEATRIEHRVGGADLNPYLSLAAILAAGRHGLTGSCPAAPLLTGNTYTAEAPPLPAILRDALAEAAASPTLPQVIPTSLTTALVKLLQLEADLVEQVVPDSERQRYFAWA